MRITLGDWIFQVDPEATQAYTRRCSLDHCTCPYCENFYENIDAACPRLRSVLDHFGIYLNGPCEVMPLEPAMVMACYRVTGTILQKGRAQLYVDDIDLRPEPADGETFFLWVGPAQLPWTQEVPMDQVVSPANQPEFLDRMMAHLLRWAQELDTKS